MKNISITYSGITLNATFYPADNPSISTIIYYHGGGLLYGVREDLPSLYQHLFAQNGFNLLAVDYLLAPESSLTHITGSASAWVHWYLEGGFRELGQTSARPYFLFGRSAGAYLALQSAFRIGFHPQLPDPKGLLLFYGYPSLLEDEFSKPSRFYGKLPQLSREILTPMIQQQPVTHGPIGQRFSLYIYGRQSGDWVSMCATPEEAQACSFSNEELARLPPAFLTASSTDCKRYYNS